MTPELVMFDPDPACRTQVDPNKYERMHRWVAALPEIKGRTMRVYHFLQEVCVDEAMDRKDADGNPIRYSAAEVSRRSKVSRGNVYQAIKWLESRGVLVITRRPTGHYGSVRFTAFNMEYRVACAREVDKGRRRHTRSPTAGGPSGSQSAPDTGALCPPPPISLQTFEIPDHTLRSHERPEDRTSDPLPPCPAPPPPPPGPVTAAAVSPERESEWDGPDPSAEQIADWEAAKDRGRVPGSPGWDARLKLMGWRVELGRRAAAAAPPLTPVVRSWVPPVHGTAAGPPQQAAAAPTASQGLSRVAPGVGTEDLLRRLVVPGAGSDTVAAAAARIAEVHADAKSLRGYLAVCREVFENRLPLKAVIAAFRQAGKPGVRTRGAVFMEALREHRARKDPLPCSALPGRTRERVERETRAQP